MNVETVTTTTDPDPAAILGAAVSLKEACEAAAKAMGVNLSECYYGGDEFMRQVMRVATLFEMWSCEFIDFDRFPEVWPYLLEDKFGHAFLEVSDVSCLKEFDGMGCLRIAMSMLLPVKVMGDIPVPVNLSAMNPNPASSFRGFQIRTVRLHHEDNEIHQYTPHDDPEDDEFGPVLFGLYGLDEDGFAEHIADRGSYAHALSLAVKLAPGVAFPATLTLADSFPGQLG